MVRPRVRAPTCPLATPLWFCPESRFTPPSPTVHTGLLPSDDVCRRCNLACDRLFTLVVKFLHAPFWRPCTLAPGDTCTPLPPLRYASDPINVYTIALLKKLEALSFVRKKSLFLHNNVVTKTSNNLFI